MKKNGFWLIGLSAAAMLTMSGCLEKQNELHESTISCPENTQLISDDFEGKPVCQLRGTYVDNIHLTNDKFWALKGEVHIGIDSKEEARLVIDPGTTVFGKTGADFLIVTRGSQIIAEGTSSQPIIFTSMKDAAGLLSTPGDWGGIAIAGYGPTNAGKEERFEFSNTDVRFGGDNEEDNSGILKYVQIRYAGNEVRPGEELNGLSLGGVGRKTTIDYVEVYNGKDDGIEAWGGNVNMKHIILIGNGDDNLDFDHGYRGNIQYVYIKQTTVESIHARGIETDNNKKSQNAEPRTLAKVANFEIDGTKKTSEAVFSRVGSGLTLYNGVIRNVGGVGIVVKSEGQERFKTNRFDGVYLFNCARGDVEDEAAGINDLLTFNKTFNSTVVTEGNYIAQVENDFFEQSNFIGAYRKNSDWRQGWSVLN
ncbi:hypothetical protein [Sulfurimonas sp. HSL3-7]|uniref:hypothetical protein n=1 Tax=Sulfonitrofixus jiaomeiensis TaxID=3131938 RepID=UPI0031F84988